MNTEELKLLLTNKSLELINDDQDAAHGLRLLVTDAETGEVGLLAIEPCELVLPDEVVLSYLYQMLQSPFSTPPEECLIADLQTRVERDFPPDQLPF